MLTIFCHPIFKNKLKMKRLIHIFNVPTHDTGTAMMALWTMFKEYNTSS